MKMQPWTKHQIAELAANLELRPQIFVNLGIGIPTLVANYAPSDMAVTFQSENGLLGLGSYPYESQVNADLINAGKETVTAVEGASFFCSSESFAMIRGGHIDLAIIGGMEVSAAGDLANWTVPNKMVKGMGGAMDLVYGAKRVVVLMEHVTREGEHKLVQKCVLPLTGVNCVDRVISTFGVFDFTASGVKLIKKAPGIGLEYIRAHTGFDFELDEVTLATAV